MLHRILHGSTLAGVLVLLLAGCGGHAAVIGTKSGSPSTGLTGSPLTEGTGPESPQSPTSGEVSISVAGLPIGDGHQEGDNNGNDECISVQWLGTIPHPGVVLTVTNVVVSGPFMTVTVATAGCPQSEGNSACIGSQFSAANDNAGTICFAGVEYTGPPITDPDNPAIGFLGLVGELNCPNVDSATCQRYRSKMLEAGSSSVQIRFYAPPTGPSSAPPTGSSTPPPDTGTTPPPDTNSPSAGTSSPSP